MTKDAYFFSHDSNARYDPDICDMRTIYGSEGYGWYWMLVELMREQSDYMLPLCKCNAYAMQMQCDKNAAEKFINDCINQFNLFQTDGENFWSDSLLRRMKRKDEKSEKARQAATSRWGSERNANAMQTQCERNAIKEKKVKEIKVKESKEEVPFNEVFDLYLSLCPNLIKIRERTETRKKAIKATWGKHPDITYFQELFQKANESSFLAGNNDRGFKADFDWVLKPNNAIKIMEGRYQDREPAPHKQQGQAKPVDPKFDLLNWGQFGEGGN